eukprot:7029502-Alexandrium_andersonii.AAC.1
MAAPGITLPVGSELLVRYRVRGPEEWHARLVVGHVGSTGHGDYWIIGLTPHHDVYEEDVGANSANISGCRQ